MNNKLLISGFVAGGGGTALDDRLAHVKVKDLTDARRSCRRHLGTHHTCLNFTVLEIRADAALEARHVRVLVSNIRAWKVWCASPDHSYRSTSQVCPHHHTEHSFHASHMIQAHSQAWGFQAWVSSAGARLLLPSPSPVYLCNIAIH